MRGEVAAGAGVHRHVERQRHRERPHRVGLRLLLEGDRQHALVHARPGPATPRRSRSSRPPSRRCAPAAAACRLRRAPRRGTARASSRPRTGRAPCRRRSRRCRRSVISGVGEGPVDRLAAQAGHRDVLALGAVVGLADADDGGRLACSISSLAFHARTRGSAGVPARWSRGRGRRRRDPSQTRRAASPIRFRPLVNIGLPVRAPPRRVDRTSSPSPSSRRRISSWCENGACSSATSTPAIAGRLAARAAEGDRVRSRPPRWSASTLCAKPVIQAGRSTAS